MLPPQYRESLQAWSDGGKFVLTCMDGCLVGYPLPEWEEFEQQLMQIKRAPRKLRDFRRVIIGWAEEMVCDKQGRVQISASHREYAGLGKDLELVGQLKKFEIWNPERLRSVGEQNFDDVTQELEESGIDIPL